MAVARQCTTHGAELKKAFERERLEEEAARRYAQKAARNCTEQANSENELLIRRAHEKDALVEGLNSEIAALDEARSENDVALAEARRFRVVFAAALQRAER